MVRFTGTDPDTDVVADDDLQDIVETEAPAGKPTDDEVDRPVRRKGLHDRLGYLNRHLAEQTRTIEALKAEMERATKRSEDAHVVRTIDDAEASIGQRIADAERRRRDARESGETDQEFKADADLAELRYRKAQLSDHRETLKARANETPAQQTPQRPAHVQEFIDQNSDWFRVENGQPGGDSWQKEMTSKAFALEAELSKQGYEQGSPRMLKAIEARMAGVIAGEPSRDERGRFTTVELDDNGEPVTTRRPAAAAANGNGNGAGPSVARLAGATAGGTSANGERRTVRLTAEHVEFAKKMGISPAQYAMGMKGGRYAQ